MSETELNKRMARRILDAMSCGDTRTLLDAFAEGGHSRTMGNIPLSGIYPRDTIVKLAGTILDAFPSGLSFSVVGMVAEGDKVAVEAVSNGVHVSGKAYSNEYHFLFEFKEGKVLSIKEYMDTDLANRVLCGAGS